VKAGVPKPDIHSADAVKQAVLDAKAVAHSAGASRLYIVRMFDQLGVSEQARAKTATVKQGEPVGEIVARENGFLVSIRRANLYQSKESRLSVHFRRNFRTLPSLLALSMSQPKTLTSRRL